MAPTRVTTTNAGRRARKVSSPPDSDGLKNRGDPADHQRGESSPGNVRFGLVRYPSHYDYGQDHRRNYQHGGLESGANGHQVGRTVIRLVADVFVHVCSSQ